MTKNSFFAPNLAFFGPKILIFMEVSKSFGTNITENHQELDQMGQKCQYLANLAVYGPKILIFMEVSKS